ncbi:MAG: RidA family protein [Proteobacteria bacterium]|nr:RidA family protein [Pseudomonadota bacterium]
MPKKALRLGKPFEDTVLFSFGVVASGRFLHTAGITARDRDGAVVGADDMAAQVRQCFNNLEDILTAAGADFSQVVKYMIYTTDIERYDQDTRDVRARYFVDRPACTLVEVSRLIHPDMLVEIEAIVNLADEPD